MTIVKYIVFFYRNSVNLKFLLLFQHVLKKKLFFRINYFIIIVLLCADHPMHGRLRGCCSCHMGRQTDCFVLCFTWHLLLCASSCKYYLFILSSLLNMIYKQIGELNLGDFTRESRKRI